MTKWKNRTGRPWRGGRVPRGVSMVELSIALALVGLVSLAIIGLLSKPTAFVNDVSERLDKSAQADSQGAALVRNLSRSFPMRRGFFNCGTSQVAKLLSLKDALPNTDVPAKFEVNASFTVVSSQASSLGAIDATKNLVLPGQSRVTVGSLLLLSLMNHPAVGGVYLVTEADPDQALYAIEPVTNLPNIFGCTLANSLSVDELLSDTRGQMGGVRTKTYRADVIQLFRYEIKDDPKGGKFLVEKAWPANGSEDEASSIKETISYDDYLGLAFEGAKWSPQNGTSQDHGRFQSGLIVKTRVSLGKRSLASRQVSRQVAYTTTDGGNVNTGTVTAPQAADYKFPTCSLLANPVRGMFHYDNENYSDMFRVEARVADAATVAKVEIRLGSSGADMPVCWQESDAAVGADNRLVYSSLTGMSTIIAVGPKPSGGLSSVICDTPPGSRFSGTLVYFHAALNAIVRQPCSPATIPDEPISYVYDPDNAPTACKKNGEISFGRLLLGEYDATGVVLYGENPPEPGPVLYVGADSCKWSSTPANFTDCQPRPDRGDLLRISMRPKNVPGGIPFALPSSANPDDKNELDCN